MSNRTEIKQVQEEVKEIHNILDSADVSDVTAFSWVLKSVITQNGGITMCEFHGEVRLKEFVKPRQMFMYIMRAMFPSLSLKKIGALAKEVPYDHSSVFYHVTEAGYFVEAESNYRILLKHLLSTSLGMYHESLIRQSA